MNMLTVIFKKTYREFCILAVCHFAAVTSFEIQLSEFGSLTEA